jgi:hypothetical protein
MLCQYCLKFDYDQLIQKPGYVHHPSWQALCLSVLRGCAVCALVSCEARGRGGTEDEHKWKEMEESEQVYCSLSNGTIYWNYGSIQRSSTSVFVTGKAARPCKGHILTFISR